MDAATKRLTRSSRDRVFGGVCGGLAQYIGHDAVLVRVGFVALALLAGFGAGGILLYLFAWVIIPLDRDESTAQTILSSPPRDGSSRIVIGLLLVVAGLMALGLSFLPFFWRTPDWRIAGPIVIIALGVGLLLWRRDRDAKKSSRQTDSGGKDSAADPSGAFAGERTARRLVRRHRGRKIAGVCEGFGHYFGIDPTIVRVIWLALALVGGAGLLLYLILWIAMPLEE